MRIKPAELTLLFLFSLMGCATPIDKYLKEHPDTPASIKTSMNYKLICIGMTREQLAAVRGKPTKIVKDEFDNKETWEYTQLKSWNKPCETLYYAFDNDQLVRIEDTKKRHLRQIEKYFKEHPERSSYKETVIHGKTKKDMNREEAKLSLGEPKEINKSNTLYTSFEQWIYEIKEKGHANYLYFGNDKLLNWQE